MQRYIWSQMRVRYSGTKEEAHSEMDRQDDTEFTVRDRRSGPSDTDAGATPGSAETGARMQPGPGSSGQGGEQEKPPNLDFSAFVISLATTVQMNLGAIPHPETNQTEQNVPAAKQMIDVLDMLKEKTKGNLTDAEGKLLEQVLYNLRLHYIRTVEGPKKPGGS